jgi:squalene synthase HpnC
VTTAARGDPLRSAGGENFPVASRILPRTVRGHLYAVYAFARFVDDIGDEVGPPGRDVLAALDAVDADLDRIFSGTPAHLPPLRPLLATVEACALPRAPFDALVTANRQDQVVTAYGTREELLDYCVLSANPVGRLVLAVFGVTPSAAMLRRSDDVCTALQLIEHWQDVREDATRGRVYLPSVDLDRHGVEREDLLRDHATPALRALLADVTGWAEEHLRRGSYLVGDLRGAARLAVAGYVAGGAAAADALARAGFDPLPRVPQPRSARVLRTAVRLHRTGGLR